MDVLIDTDVDFDDYLAILYLLAHPDVNVVGISVTGCGAAHLDKGFANLRNLLTVFDERVQGLPVLRGAKAPLRYSNVFPSWVREPANAHYNIRFPSLNPSPPLPGRASDWIATTLKRRSEPLDILLLGGGTNLALAFQQLTVEERRRSIRRIIMMGGNLLPEYVDPGARGNVLDTLGATPYYTNQVAEWNIFIDVKAAQDVIESGIPVELITLNACNDVPITAPLVDQLRRIDTLPAKLICDILDHPEIQKGIDSHLHFWDPLVATVLVKPSLVKTQRFSVRIEQALNEEHDTSGKVIIDDDHGSTITIALSADREAVIEEFVTPIKAFR